MGVIVSIKLPWGARYFKVHPVSDFVRSWIQESNETFGSLGYFSSLPWSKV